MTLEFEWIALGLLFLLTVAATFSFFQWLVNREERTEEEMLHPEGDPVTGEEPRLVLGSLTEPLAQSPMSEKSQSAIGQELREAGFYRPTALMEYRALRTVFIVLPILATLILSLAVENARLLPIWIGGAIAAALGFSLPRLYVNYLARSRNREIERGLPVAVDLMTLSLTGGANVYTSLARVSKEIEHSYPVLAEELQIVQRQAEMGSLDIALRNFGERTSVQEVKNLALVLSQTERLGTDITSALLEFSNNFRIGMRQRAEAQANKASFWMLFPTILCLWIPAAIILMGPVYYEFWRKRTETRELLQKDRGAIESQADPTRLTPLQKLPEVGSMDKK